MILNQLPLLDLPVEVEQGGPPGDRISMSMLEMRVERMHGKVALGGESIIWLRGRTLVDLLLVCRVGG
jgi:hypothetical protein